MSRVGPELGLTSFPETPSLSKITRGAQSVVKPINTRQALSERLDLGGLSQSRAPAVAPKDSTTTTIMPRLVALLLAAAATAASADENNFTAASADEGR